MKLWYTEHKKDIFWKKKKSLMFLIYSSFFSSPEPRKI